MLPLNSIQKPSKTGQREKLAKRSIGAAQRTTEAAQNVIQSSLQEVRETSKAYLVDDPDSSIALTNAQVDQTVDQCQNAATAAIQGSVTSSAATSKQLADKSIETSATSVTSFGN